MIGMHTVMEREGKVFCIRTLVQSALSDSYGGVNSISHGEVAGVRVRLSGATLSPGLGPDIFVQAGALLGVGDLLKAFLSPTIETITPTRPVSCLDISLCFSRHYWITFFLWLLLKVCPFATVKTHRKLYHHNQFSVDASVV
jgi:hypothetical protein